MQRHRPFRTTLSPLLLTGALLCHALAGQAAAAGTAGGSAISPEQARQILEEFREVRKLLEKIEIKRSGGKPSQPAKAMISTRGMPSMGLHHAPVTVVEFADFHNPASQRFNRTTFPALKRQYIDTGRLRWVVLDLPSPARKHADRPVQAVLCAGAQGEYWSMRRMLFDNPGRLALEQLPAHADRTGVDMKGFMACLHGRRYLDAIADDAQTVKDLGLDRPPGFIIGRTTGDIIKGKLISGAPPLQQFEAAIDGLLKKPPAARKAAAGE